MSEWIKCDERLPDMITDESCEFRESSKVLTFCKEYGFLVAAWSESLEPDGSVWERCWVGDCGPVGLSYKITHWQPLPQAPNE